MSDGRVQGTGRRRRWRRVLARGLGLLAALVVVAGCYSGSKGHDLMKRLNNGAEEARRNRRGRGAKAQQHYVGRTLLRAPSRRR